MRLWNPIVFVLVGMVIAATPEAFAQERSPNIVLIMADDMGYECIGANGGSSYATPNLDKLAMGGMRFENCHSQPLCTPSRVQIMTGQYNNRNYTRFGELDPSAVTFANMLRGSGYATAVVGKWQLEGGFDGPGRFGFDEYCLWQLSLHGGKSESRYPNPTIEVNGELHRLRNGEYGPDVVSAYACDFIARAAQSEKQKPFFLYYPMILPHWPFEPTPASEDWDPSAKGKRGVANRAYFADMVAYVDQIIGRLAETLKANGLRENTLILFTCDNGTMNGIVSQIDGAPYEGGKRETTDNGTHVPLIANWPGTVPAGSVNDELVDFTDILPTLLAAAGEKAPKDVPLDGRSILPQLKGEPGPPREWIYCWYYRSGKVGSEPGGEFARTERYKYYIDGKMFDVIADPLEESPLDENVVPDVREMLRGVVDERKRASTEADSSPQ